MKARAKVLIGLVVVLAMMVFTAPAMAETKSGTYNGSNLTWSYDTDSKTLTISGSGEMTQGLSTQYMEDFNDDRTVVEKVVIGEGVTNINSYAFSEFSNLKEVTISSTVTSIKDLAFNKCTSLESITIPDGVTALYEYSFNQCTNLKTVTIGKGLQTVHPLCLDGCSALQSITVDTDNPNITADNCIIYNKTKTTVLANPLGKEISDAITITQGDTTNPAEIITNHDDTNPIVIESPGDYIYVVESKGGAFGNGLNRVEINPSHLPVGNHNLKITAGTKEATLKVTVQAKVTFDMNDVNRDYKDYVTIKYNNQDIPNTPIYVDPSDNNNVTITLSAKDNCMIIEETGYGPYVNSQEMDVTTPNKVYTKTLTIGNDDLTISLLFHAQKLITPPTLQGSHEFIYDGTEKTVLEDPAADAGYTLSGNKATRSGEYEVQARLTDPDNSVWANTGDVQDKTLGTWNIKPKPIDLPESKTFTYNGTSFVGVEETDDYDIEGTVNHSEVGTHTTTVRLKDKLNTVWKLAGDQTTTEDQTINWKIQQGQAPEAMKKVEGYLQIGYGNSAVISLPPFPSDLTLDENYGWVKVTVSGTGITETESNFLYQDLSQHKLIVHSDGTGSNGDIVKITVPLKQRDSQYTPGYAPYSIEVKITLVDQPTKDILSNVENDQMTITYDKKDAQIVPSVEGAETQPTFTFTSGNTAILTVESDGTIKPVSTGRVAVIISSEGTENYKVNPKTVNITITEAKDVITAPEKLTVEKGQTENISATCKSAECGGSLHFFSDNEAVATVNQQGEVKGISEGTATIYIDVVPSYIKNYEHANQQQVEITVTDSGDSSGGDEPTPKQTPTKAQYTMTPLKAEYDGKTHKPTIVPQNGAGSVTKVSYYKDNKAITGEPKEVGKYTVKINTAVNDTYEAATDLSLGIFEIVKGKPTKDLYTMTPAEEKYDGKTHKPTIKPKEGAGDVDKVYYYLNNKEITGEPKDAGTYVVKIDTKANDNYEAKKDLELGTFKITDTTPTKDLYTMTPAEVEYDGKTHKPTITPAEGAGAVDKVHYYLNGKEITGEPKDVGTYVVKIDTKANDNYKAEKNLEIGNFIIKEKAPDQAVAYSAHVQNVGWQPYVTNGTMAGTVDRSLRMEAMKINLQHQKYKGDIEYRSYIENIGWESGWKKNDTMSGTSKRSLRLEAMQVRLTGEMAEHYDVYYRVHAENIGWMNWAKNGEQAGTAGYAYRLEAMQVVLVDKGGAAPNIAPSAQTDKHFTEKYKDNVKEDSLIVYQTHVQNVGWQDYAVDGSNAGTDHQSLRLEGMKMYLNNPKYEGDIEYRTHIENIGWENEWKKNNAMSGTSGRSLRLEAMQVRLTGEMAKHYDVYYRVHAQNIGWMNWAKNGEQAGTAGYAYRLEAMQVVLVEKDGAAPALAPNSDTDQAFAQK